MKKYLREAIEKGEPDVVEKLLSQYPRWANHTYNDNLKPLQLAIIAPMISMRCLRALVNAGADVKGCEILHWAVADISFNEGARPQQYIPFLVEAGAPLEEVNIWGWTPLMHAIIEAGCGSVRALLDAGADFEKTVPANGMTAFNQGQSILSLSWFNTNPVAALKAILAAGANVNKRDDFGRTALEYFQGIPIEKYSEFRHYKRFAAVRLKCIELLQSD